MSPLRQILVFVRPYGRLAVLSLVLLVGTIAIDLSIPRLIQRIIDRGISMHDGALVLHTAVLMIGLSVLGAILAIGNNYFSVRVGEGVAADLRDALFTKIQSFSHANLDRFPTGDLLVRLSSDTNAAQRWAMVTLRIGTRAPLLMTGSLILMFRTNAELAVKVLPLLAATLAVTFWFGLRMEPFFGRVQKQLARLNQVLQENIAGVRLVKAFARSAHEAGRFAAANNALARLTVKVMRYMESMAPTLGFIIGTGVVLVIWAGGCQVIRNDLTLGQIVAFSNYMLTTVTPLIMMARLSNVWASGMASMRRINKVLDEVPDIQDIEAAQSLPSDSRGAIRFEKVVFTYGNAAAPVLRGIDLDIEPGRITAILGATGSGKSTLVNLIPRFYDPSQGRILMDGTDLRHLNRKTLLGRIGVVPQETILFSGSILDNLRLGCEDASKEDLMAAARMAQAEDFILRLPQGADSRVEERGVNLSGGQKQRLAIARALVSRPDILILDDSTSAVDIETEARIHTAIQAGLPHTTLVIVAQRITTVLKADQIIVLDQGRLQARGNHARLLAHSPVYREIFESQLGPLSGDTPVMGGLS